jgi:hypothetical protein
MNLEFLMNGPGWMAPDVRNMMATQDGNLVLACSGVDRIALVGLQ